VVDWIVTGTDLHAKNAGGAHGAQWADDMPASDDARGRNIETAIRIDAGRGLGLWVCYRASPSTFVVSLNVASQQIELGTLTWINDRLVKSFACREGLAPAVHGFYCDVADGIFTAPRRWLMTV
jgi:hypothetical protein